MADSTTLYQRSPMPVNYVRNFVELMANSGLDKTRLLATAGLTEEQVFGSDDRLRFSQFRAVMLAGHKLSGDAALGLHLGKRLTPTAHGFLGYAVISSANLADIMRLVQRYFCTRTRLLASSFQEDDKGGVLQFHEMMDLGDIRRTYLEVTVGAVVNAMRFIVGDATGHCRIEMPYVAPTYADSYADLLGMPVQFGGLTLTLHLPSRVLNKPLPMADAASRKMAADKCEEELQRLESDQDMEARVRQQLMQADVDLPSVETLASRFHMTSRTLRRRLEVSDTTYQAILDDVRRLRAQRYLANHKPVQEVAWLLGYADPANFSRAFRKWTGETPTVFLTHIR